MKHGSVPVAIQHHAGMTAANTVNVKQPKPVDFIALEVSTFTHRNISPVGWIKKLRKAATKIKASSSL
jgi:hypothetical protein